LVRDFNEFKYRPKSQGNIIVDTSYVKTFNWMRNYSLQWDITTSLKFSFNANASARLEEPQGLIDTKEKRAEIWNSFGKGGLMTMYDQRFEVTYQLPINKIPLFNWLTVNGRYTGLYRFTGVPPSLIKIGNTIDNSNQIQLNGQINLQTLYNNIPYLKKINTPAPPKRSTPAPAKGDSKDKKSGSKSKKDSLEKTNYGKIIGDGTLRFLMMLRSINVSWSQGKGTILPGYMYSPDLFGINFKTNSPGFLYVFGGQPDIQQMAKDGDWISKDTRLNTPFSNNFNQTISARAQLEPFKEFRIDVMANRTYIRSFTEYFKADSTGAIGHFSQLTTGNFNISYVGLGTFFKKGENVFNEFLDIRLKLAERIAKDNPNSSGVDSTGIFPIGYGALSQEVLLYSFMSAYMGKNSQKMKVNSPFITFPLPNWQLRYNGLTKIKAMAKAFQNFSINHNYNCTYSIGSYRSNILYKENGGKPSEPDPLGNFIPEYEMAQISLMERFEPLVGFDMTLTNSMMVRVDYAKSRNIALSFANNQITEMNSNKLSVSAGYRFKDLKIGINIGGSKRQIVSDLNLTVGFSMTDNTTTLRKVAENVSQVSSGMLNFSINATADYQVSNMVGLRLFYNQIINKPYISTQYQNSNIEAGLSVRLMLTQ
jgi:cell surface protein SprA